MPTPEQPTTTQPENEALTGIPDLHEQEEQHEQRYKTIAVRVEEQLHSQLQFIAQLGETSLSDEIRTSIQHRIDTAQTDPVLIRRAQEVREEIEREAAARSAAIAGFMGHSATAAVAEKPTRARRTTKNEQ